MPSPSDNDRRVKETKKHLRLLARRHHRRITVNDYLGYRESHARHLPAMTTLYRLFGSWPQALEAAGIDQNEEQELSRTPDERLIDALKQASEDLEVSVLSSHAYDEWRNQQPDPKPPSSSVIRKWLGPWSNAVSRAGLEPTERSTPRRPTQIEIIDALRQAKDRVPGMLTQRSYSEFVAALPVEERELFPDVISILNAFPNWELALRAADVEQADTIHPDGLWTAEEARRIAHQCETITGAPLTKESYAGIVAASKTPKPSWETLSELLRI